uniref:Uncharacterized protein n=1 Tax=Cucumis melo TaxID=3656 RepID=A0A9I9E4U6_CUCME
KKKRKKEKKKTEKEKKKVLETFFNLSPSKLNRHPWRWFGGEKMMG